MRLCLLNEEATVPARGVGGDDSRTPPPPWEDSPSHGVVLLRENDIPAWPSWKTGFLHFLPLTLKRTAHTSPWLVRTPPEESLTLCGEHTN